MSLPADVLKQIKCCLNEDEHILIDPVLLKCGANACKECISESLSCLVKCLNCNGSHSKYDYFTINKLANSLIHFVMKDLSGNLHKEIKSIKEDLKGLVL